MTSSFFEQKGRATDAPPDISKTNYLQTEADMSLSVNKNIDEISKSWDQHFDQLIRIWDHIHSNREKQGGLLGQVSHLLKDAEKFQEDYNEWDKFAKSYYPYAKQLRSDIQTIKEKYGSNSAEYQQYLQTQGATHDTDVNAEVETEKNNSLIESESYDAGFSLYKQNSDLASTFFNGVNNQYSDNNEIYRDIGDLKAIYPNWVDFAKRGLKVPITLDDGTVVYKTWDEANGWAEKSLVLDSINAWFAYQHEDAAKGRLGLYKREVINFMVNREDAEKAVVLGDESNALLEIVNENSSEQLLKRIQSDPGYPIRYIRNNLNNPRNLDTKGNVSHRISKQNMIAELIIGVNNETIDRQDLQPFFDYIPPEGWFDGSKVPTSKYWEKDLRPLMSALKTAEDQVAQAKQDDKKGAETEFVNDALDRFNDLEEPITLQQSMHLITTFKNKFGYSATSALPEQAKPLLNIAYQGMKDDNIIYEQLRYRRYVLNEQITLADLVGITHPDLKAKIIKDLVKRPGGLSKGDANTPGTMSYRNARVEALVKGHLQITTTEQVKDQTFYSYFDQALPEYDKVYNAAKSAGASDENAHKEAMAHLTTEIVKTKKVKQLNNKGKIVEVEIPQWSTYGPSTFDKNQALLNIKLADSIVKDRSLLNQATPFDNEFKHLETAAKYIANSKEGKPGLFPEFYRFMGAKIGMDPYKLMLKRLTSTGYYKDGEVKVIEEGMPGERLLGTNVSPNRTIRAIVENLGGGSLEDHGNYQWMINASAAPGAVNSGFGYAAIKNPEGKYVNIEEILDKKIEEITLGEVYGLAASGYSNLGIFDLTYQGLHNLIQETELNLNTTWGPEGQNLLYMARIRQKAQANQNSTGIATEYRRLVYIDKDLKEKFKQIAPDLPPWLDLNTLSPAAAKELVQMLTVQQE